MVMVLVVAGGLLALLIPLAVAIWDDVQREGRATQPSCVERKP